MSGGKLPEGWVKSDLDNILLSIIGGGTPSKAIPEYYQGDIPWMSVKDMNKHALTDTIDHISSDAIENSSTNVIPAGTPIIATRMSLGKIVTASFDSAINQDLKALFLSSGVDRNFFIHWYRSQAQLIESLGTGTTVKGIRLEVLKALSINLPPLFEQKIIAEKLDTLLAQVDSTKVRLEKIPQILKRFRQAVLAAAVNGDLTAEWRMNNNSNIVEEEIEKIKNKLIAKKIVKKDLTYSKLDRKYQLPSDWLYVKLQSIATKITDGEHKTPKRESAGQLLISARNIQDGYLKLSDVDYVSDAEFQKLRNRCDPDSGDVLISCSGSIGRVCLVDENSKYVMVRSVALIKLMQDFVINKYIMYLLQSPLLQKDIEENSKSTAQANLFLGPIKNLGIPLPPVTEQAEIVRRVEQLFAYADTIEKQVNNALARVNSLTQSILAKAFRGELTAQWRAENPDLISGENSAAALLEKIKAERAASSGKRAARRKA
ncbi:restriction endonuclease subunit S [Serratia marcescens]|uniref:restriction endonuclease subunit S n=1 Tax=Serratia marcescens TaxID=615 RepID=UPI0002B86BAB|nr:restriction endonuclease subunit S [Serratia marcescens]EMF05887.1 type-1 restriction enzyme StySJI specificity protein [Serratia marcescens VGH107]